MYSKYTVGEIRELNPMDQVMEYLHRNNIPLTADTLTLYSEQIKSALNIPDIPAEAYDYLAKRKWEYRESDIKTHHFKNGHIDLFLHPRFIPISIHSHSYFEVKYLLSGSANISAAEYSVSLKTGDLLFIAPGIKHMVDVCDADTLLINIIITPDAVRSAFPHIYFSENPISLFFTNSLQGRINPPFLLCCTNGSESVQELILAAYHKRNSPSSIPYHILCESIIENLLLEILASHTDDFAQTDPSSLPEKLFPILGFINEHCASISLTTLAQIFNYSPAHLSRLINQYTGKSFSSILRSARLAQASTLLLSSDLSIQDVMLRTGYTGKAHFYRVFREVYGMTPAQFRKQMGSAK